MDVPFRQRLALGLLTLPFFDRNLSILLARHNMGW
jgi:hypothetical protein